MRKAICRIALVLVTSVTALPITPAAPNAQYLADQLRSEGMTERDIAARLASQSPMSDNLNFPLRLQSIFGKQPERDTTGDISPSSLEAPEMLPRAAAPESLPEAILGMVYGVFQGDEFESHRFGYEGKENEMRRPEGMRHWS